MKKIFSFLIKFLSHQLKGFFLELVKIFLIECFPQKIQIQQNQNVSQEHTDFCQDFPGNIMKTVPLDMVENFILTSSKFLLG